MKKSDEKPTPPAEEESVSSSSSSSTMITTVAKFAVASAFLLSALTTYINNNNNNGGTDVTANMIDSTMFDFRRQLSMVGDTIPKYMEPLMKELRERKKLFDDTPPEEIKYWFEYTGPLQVSLF